MEMREVIAEKLRIAAVQLEAAKKMTKKCYADDKENIEALAWLQLKVVEMRLEMMEDK